MWPSQAPELIEMYLLIGIIVFVAVIVLVVGALFIAGSSGFDQNVKH